MKHDRTDQFSEEEFIAFRKVCKEHGIKVTPQRLEIFREVMRARDHPSAEDIYRRVKDRLPSISLDTVYRTLSAFESYGLIGESRSQTRHGSIQIARLHHHLVCTVCKGLTDFYWAEFDRLDSPFDVSEWGHPESRHVQIEGICSKCATKRRKA